MKLTPPQFYYFFIGKIYSIDNCEMTNVFNVITINYTAIQSEKPKGQLNLISSAWDPEYF